MKSAGFLLLSSVLLFAAPLAPRSAGAQDVETLFRAMARMEANLKSAMAEDREVLEDQIGLLQDELTTLRSQSAHAVNTLNDILVEVHTQLTEIESAEGRDAMSDPRFQQVLLDLSTVLRELKSHPALAPTEAEDTGRERSNRRSQR